ncbi:MAG: PTS sugar transporter subunit IIA [Rectinema sp.]|nr:PTS sugar transporter subunit IIA [Rectinema sp.]
MTNAKQADVPAFVPVVLVSVLLTFTSVAGGIPARTATISLASAFLCAGLVRFSLPRLTAFVFRHASPGGTIETSFLLFIIFALAYGGTILSIPPWFMAFMTGVSLSRTISPSQEQRARLFQLGEGLFVPATLLLFGVTIPAGSLAKDITQLFTIFLILGSGFLSYAIVILLSRIYRGFRNPSKQFAMSYACFSMAVAWILAEAVSADVVLLPSAILLAALSALLRPLQLNLRVQVAESIPAPTSAAEDTIRLQELGTQIPSRIMIALSKPSSIPSLLELAEIMHGSKNNNPLFPIVVHTPDDVLSPQALNPETVLAGAVMRLSEMKKNAFPINIEALSPGKGIAEESRTRNADTILIGWNRPPRLANAFFGNIIDQVIAGTDQMILVARAVFSWKQTQQLFIILPPFVETHPGFASALQTIEKFTDRVYCRVVLAIQEENAQELVKRMRNHLPPGRWKETIFRSWRDIPAIVHAATGSRDAVLLVCARPGEVSWFPALERLPHLLAEKSKNANVAMLYLPGVAFFARAGMAQQAAEMPPSVMSASAELALRNALQAGRIRVNMQQAALADGILDLLFAALPNAGKGRIQELANHFINTVQQQPIELEPGAVLLHERIEDINHPILCLGAHRTGFRIAALARPVQILVLILVPANQSAREHLQFLAEVAGLFRNARLAKRLLEAEKPADILAPHA